ncbi:MAG: glycosyltransferase, partial [Eubacterium sp.]
FKETNAVLDRIVTQGYKQLVENVPKLYEQMYNQFNNMTPFQQNIFNMMTRIMNPDIVPLIQNEKPHLLISTHPFVTNILGSLKEHGAIEQPILSFVTDYKIHSVYLHKKINAYVVGSEYTKETMVEKGVSPEIVYPFGIPIRQEFVEETKKRAEKEDPSIRGTILLMAGSLGTKQMEKAFAALMKAEERIKLIVVCGNNQKVQRSIEFLNQVYKTADKVVEIYGFVDNIPELMDEADAIITKPGGLTSTEAIVKCIPMIIPYYYPGQEEENADYLVESGMAIKVDKIKDLTSMVDFLIENKYIIQQMSENMSEEGRHHSMKKTVELCETLIKEYENGEKIPEL